ncbi:MAG: YfjI family protein [Gemmatimonadaceae bacterium]|nr:YfjI family protein [Gemmatimonadaceae bacterium]
MTNPRDVIRAAAADAHAELDEAESTPRVRPSFDEAALYGLAGEWARLWGPHTEAAPVAVYATALAALGALIGRGPAWDLGSERHHAVLFVLLIGRTSEGRKGTALGLGVNRLLELIDDDFRRDRRTSGLSSAEGLIALVRDATPDRAIGDKVVAGDPGVTDKRLLVEEHEAGGAFEAMSRESNRLSAILRDAWDGRDLGTLTRREPQRATRPHVVVVGAITEAELRTVLKATAVRNGLANRFLAVHTHRARLVPHPTSPPAQALDDLANRIARAVVDARRIGHVRWTPAAANRWVGVHERLSVLTGTESVCALQARGPAYVYRLAMLLALLDGTGDVDVPHLEAALALWEYSASTWQYIYGDGVARSPLAERIHAALEDAGPAGLTRSAIRSDVVGSNSMPSRTIDAARRELEDAGAIVADRLKTGGRPAVVWRSARHTYAPRGQEQREQREGTEQVQALSSLHSYSSHRSDAHVDRPPTSPSSEWPARIKGPPPVDDGYFDALSRDAIQRPAS